ncbi:MAG: NYN domain-containing protein [Acidimicrobiales bacterium]|nr:NYN domain-containing protein [Acidimicrobiales bacterium]
MAERFRSALFVDFDNIFGGLLDLDRAAAMAFVNEPHEWIERMAVLGLPPGDRRDFLVRRAYLNPAGWRMDPELGKDAGRLVFQRFRPNLTRAGFEVVDCPALTSRHKNAADIRIVMDVLDCLDARTHYDEVVLASSDADFTPLLQRIRSQDRRTALMSAGPAAPAYRSVADWYLDEEALIDLLLGEPEPTHEEAGTVAGGPLSPVDREPVERLVRAVLQRSAAPVLLSQMGLELRDHMGAEITATKWFGARTLGEFLRSMEPPLGLDSRCVWDPERHEAPVAAPLSADPPANTNGLPPLIVNVCQVTDLPRLDTAVWPRVLAALAEYVRTHDFNFNESSAWVRDQLAATELPVGRTPVVHTVRAALYGGASFNGDPAPSAEDLLSAVLTNTIDRAQSAGLPLTEAEVEELEQWLRGKGAAAS